MEMHWTSLLLETLYETLQSAVYRFGSADGTRGIDTHLSFETATWTARLSLAALNATT